MTTLTTHDELLLQYVAQTYLARYPLETKRIARAVALVETGHVALQPDGTALVTSQHGAATYTVNGTCNCLDLTAPHFCKHALARTLFHKVACLRRKARHAMWLDAAGAQVAGVAWPSLDGEQIMYAPDEDGYADRMWPVTATYLVLLGYVEN